MCPGCGHEAEIVRLVEQRSELVATCLQVTAERDALSRDLSNCECARFEHEIAVLTQERDALRKVAESLKIVKRAYGQRMSPGDERMCAESLAAWEKIKKWLTS